jgi:hypothetical protein
VDHDLGADGIASQSDQPRSVKTEARGYGEHDEWDVRARFAVTQGSRRGLTPYAPDGADGRVARITTQGSGDRVKKPSEPRSGDTGVAQGPSPGYDCAGDRLAFQLGGPESNQCASDME